MTTKILSNSAHHLLVVDFGSLLITGCTKDPKELLKVCKIKR